MREWKQDTSIGKFYCPKCGDVFTKYEGINPSRMGLPPSHNEAIDRGSYIYYWCKHCGSGSAVLHFTFTGDSFIWKGYSRGWEPIDGEPVIR